MVDGAFDMDLSGLDGFYDWVQWMIIGWDI